MQPCSPAPARPSTIFDGSLGSSVQSSTVGLIYLHLLVPVSNLEWLTITSLVSVSLGLNMDSGQSVQNSLAGKHIVSTKAGKGRCLGWLSGFNVLDAISEILFRVA